MTTSERAGPVHLFWSRRRVFFTVSALFVLGTLYVAREVLLPFVLALVIAYVLAPLVGWVEGRKVHRVGAILLVYAALLWTLYGFVRATAPRMGAELAGLRKEELPVLAGQVQNNWIPAVTGRLRQIGLLPPSAPPPEHESPALVVRQQPDGSIGVDVGSGVELVPSHGGYLVRDARVPNEGGPFDLNRAIGDAFGKSVAYVQHNALELARIGRDVIAALSRAVFVFFLTLMLAAYLMLTRERILAFFRSLVRAEDEDDFERLLHRINGGLSGVIRGQIVICLINGVLSAVGFAFVGLHYWPVLALVCTVMSLIPIFGSIASAIPAVAIGLSQSLGTGMFVLLWIVGIHQLEANVLNPKIMGDAAKIHPVLVVFSLLVGEHLFQIVGALLAVPVMSIVQSIFLHCKDVAFREGPVPEATFAGGEAKE